MRPTSPNPGLAALLDRRSCWPLAEPGPGDAELDLIFQAALRAPDNGNLRPWRLVLIRDEARHALGEVLVDNAASLAPDSPRAAHEHHRQRAYAAPVIIALGAAITASPFVPEIEQLLSVGAAAMNMLNAVHMLGFGAYWFTGPDTYDVQLLQALDFEPGDRLVGFLLIGSLPAQLPARERPARSAHVREWLGPGAI